MDLTRYATMRPFQAPDQPFGLLMTTRTALTATLVVLLGGALAQASPPLRRPAWEHIPSGVSSVTFVAQGETSRGREEPPSTPRSLGGARAVRLAAFINGLQRLPPIFISCFLDYQDTERGLGVLDHENTRARLTFYGSSGTPTAQATETLGCGSSVQFRVAGRSGPLLSDAPTSVTEELERLGVIPVCSGWQLAPTASLPSGPNAQRMIFFNFTNTSDTACRVSGFPRVSLFDTRGRPIAVKLLDEDAGGVRHLGLAGAVALAPRQAATAWVDFARCRTRSATRAVLALPGVRRLFYLPVGSKRRPVDPCGGQLSVGNV